MKDQTYLLVQRCYLVTLGAAISLMMTVYLMIQSFVTVNSISPLQWILLIGFGSLAAALAGIGMIGKPAQVATWVDPLKIGEIFEVVVIGIGFPLFSLVWMVRKVFVRS